MKSEIDRILLTREQIASRVRELAEEITRDMEGADEHAEIVMIPIMTGSMIFAADLIRELPLRMRILTVTISSYRGAVTRSQGAAIISSIPEDIADRHVLVVDDILDSGRTLRLILEELKSRSPRSLQTCVLLRKNVPRDLQVKCEYIGFDIPDVFVVGYGLDYNNYYRNLPDIGVLCGGTSS